jgi:hypothetical protein
MASDPLSSLSPSDSGLLDPVPGMTPSHVRGGPERPPRAERESWEAPAPTEPDASRPEDSLRAVPLPPGLLGRLRRFAQDL